MHCWHNGDDLIDTLNSTSRSVVRLISSFEIIRRTHLKMSRRFTKFCLTVHPSHRFICFVLMMNTLL